MITVSFAGWGRGDWLAVISIVWTAVLSWIGYRLSEKQSRVQEILAELELREKAGVIFRGADDLLDGRESSKHTLLHDSESVLPVLTNFPLLPQSEVQLVDVTARALCRALDALGGHNDHDGQPLQPQLAEKIRNVIPKLEEQGRDDAAIRLREASERCSAGREAPKVADLSTSAGKGPRV
jgi:hypothetical protein